VTRYGDSAGNVAIRSPLKLQMPLHQFP
jgi:hypothetical protein